MASQAETVLLYYPPILALVALKCSKQTVWGPRSQTPLLFHAAQAESPVHLFLPTKRTVPSSQVQLENRDNAICSQ